MCTIQCRYHTRCLNQRECWFRFRQSLESCTRELHRSYFSSLEAGASLVTNSMRFGIRAMLQMLSLKIIHTTICSTELNFKTNSLINNLNNSDIPKSTRRHIWFLDMLSAAMLLRWRFRAAHKRILIRILKTELHERLLIIIGNKPHTIRGIWSGQSADRGV